MHAKLILGFRSSDRPKIRARNLENYIIVRYSRISASFQRETAIIKPAARHLRKCSNIGIIFDDVGKTISNKAVIVTCTQNAAVDGHRRQYRYARKTVCNRLPKYRPTHFHILFA